MEVREISCLEFQEAEIAAFAPIEPVLASFAQAHGMERSRLRDRDPINPHTAHFLSWRGDSPRTGGRCWICIRLQDPFDPAPRYRLSTSSGSAEWEWNYSSETGVERLQELLEEARLTAVRPT
jgi:hypothetical protein